MNKEPKRYRLLKDLPGVFAGINLQWDKVEDLQNRFDELLDILTLNLTNKHAQEEDVIKDLLDLKTPIETKFKTD